MNLNKVMLIGRVGKDPEINYIKEDVPVARLPIATNESYKKDDEWVDITEWHNVIAWRFTAKYCERNVKKGSLVFIEGKLQTRQWEGQDGNKRYTTEIVASTVKLLEKKQEFDGPPLPGEHDQPISQNPSESSSGNNTKNTEPFLKDNPGVDSENDSDDLPF